MEIPVVWVGIQKNPIDFVAVFIYRDKQVHLCSVWYKMIWKGLRNRLKQFFPEIATKNQNTF